MHAKNEHLVLADIFESYLNQPENPVNTFKRTSSGKSRNMGKTSSDKDLSG